MSEKNEITPVLIENKIFTFRNEQVMVDADLAEMYGVEVKRLNEQVKRNIDRFPKDFRFQLNEEEIEILQSQIAISSSRSQIATLNDSQRGKNIKYLPYVFTEQGVSMLSAVLRSETAVKVSIAIMNAFVQMRKTIGNHQQLLQLSSDFTKHKLETDEKFQQVFKALQGPEVEKKQGIFFDGQTYDAYDFVNKLIQKAKKSIVVIDNYVDDSVITQLTAKQKNVAVSILCKTISKKLKLDIEKANKQYPSFKGVIFTKAHDRFIIIDQKEVYHIGASLKDLGKKWFAFSKMEANSVSVVELIKEVI
ncbi:ORF6N domain-containing protein [Brumimicrobium oceani]|uniref:DNA-binding protein n=1 Tax=Brumimicrobium oceani TaxID=2100725 RepID=A0A2U2XBS1_9FLAO|nr:ORF6N domain-containing protein [Brumimicrobium oceani]PWH85200.1 DNA-binding protein [Brumimicrobium oceani]